MFSTTRLVCLAVLGSLLASPAQAERYDTRQIMKSGAWSVEITHNTDTGDLWCDAKTRNSSRQELSLTAFDDGELVIFVFDDGWNLARREISFLVDVDYSRWQVDGTADGRAVHVQLSNKTDAGKFVLELVRGSAVAVLNTDERRLATFSLRGSKDAILALLDCWKKIKSNDPFQRASDPF